MQSPEQQQAIDLVLAILDATATPRWQPSDLFALARSFLDTRAAQERERCAQVALNVRMDARNLAVWEVRDRIAAAIRALD